MGIGRELSTRLPVITHLDRPDIEHSPRPPRAALVGRLVLATIHASTVPLVRERFINLGVPAYLVDEVLIGVLLQRLTPKTCEACEGKGCADCGWLGSVGRTAEVGLWEAKKPLVKK